MSASKSVTLKFDTSKAGVPKDVKMAVFLADATGQVVEKRNVGKDPLVQFTVDAELAKTARMVVGPETTLEPRELTVSRLQRMHAVEVPMLRDDLAKSIRIPVIPPEAFRLWNWCSCVVRGRVVRRVGGVDMPVCQARIHVDEVDPWSTIVPTLPDDIIDRLWWHLWNKIRVPPGFPWPPPPPFERLGLGSLMPQMAATPESLEGGGGIGVPFEPRLPLSLTAPLAGSAFADVPIEAKRSELLRHRADLLPVLCKWPIWQQFHREEIVVTMTDTNGRFHANFIHPCDDKPDLYIWVEVCIAGVWTVVHQPTVACSTHWDYQCGADLLIRVTDHRAPVCGPNPTVPGDRFVVYSIGDGSSTTRIPQTGPEQGLSEGSVPFGGSLEPHAAFGSGLPAAGFAFWRWSVRKVGAVDWTPLTKEVIRHFFPSGGPAGGTEVKTLGPQTVGGSPALFELQAPSPPSGVWAPGAASRINAATGYFESHLLPDPMVAAGLYELKLELFDTAGVRRPMRQAGVWKARPRIPHPDVRLPTAGAIPDIDAPEAYLIIEPGGDVVAFRILLRVDNNPCTASSEPPTGFLGGVNDCGFIKYGASAHLRLAFRADHPFGFATFNHSVTRGTTPIGAATAAGPVRAPPGPAPPSWNGYTRSGATFTKQVPVATLLACSTCAGGTCPDGKAAFGIVVRAFAMATDGFNRQSNLDSPVAQRGFAMEP